jgi:DNA polymerase-3 subunit delta'
MTAMRGVIGQRTMLARLAARAARGELAHAYGLFGPRSIGKRTVALRLAQTLNCQHPDAPAGGCGTCLACQKIERGSHPDVTLVERDPALKEISIEQVRAMQQDLALRPLEGRRRVVIIDDAAELNLFGQDALLKTLEEPPAHAVLLLITPAPTVLHETIQSRLQPLTFRAVPTAEIATGLTERKVKDAARLAAAAGGRPGLALRLAADDAGERTQRAALEQELLRLVASGLTDRFAWAAALADESDARKRAAAIDLRLDHWVELVRDAAVQGLGLAAEGALRPDRTAQTAKIAASANARELVDTALLMEKLRRDLTWNANSRALLELFALKLPYVAGVAA